MTRSARLLTVLWPAFVMAGVLEALVFAVIDPEAVGPLGKVGEPWSPQAVYTIAFFVFGTVISAAGLMTAALQAGAQDSRS